MTELLPLNNSHLPVKLRLEDYLQLDQSGAFTAYQKTELIDGELFFMNAQHRPHALVKSRLHVLLANMLNAVGGDWEAIVEGSVAIPPNSSPEPDIVITNDPNGSGLVPLASVKLVVEVSDATLDFDTKRKLPLYARNGVAEYWIVDVNARMVHQMWAPEGETYAERREVSFGDPLTPVTLDLPAIDTRSL